MNYPLVFTNDLLCVFRTNINDSSSGGQSGDYKYFQISPNTTTAGDDPETTTVYFYETTNKRMSSIYILAIGY